MRWIRLFVPQLVLLYLFSPILATAHPGHHHAPPGHHHLAPTTHITVVVWVADSNCPETDLMATVAAYQPLFLRGDLDTATVLVFGARGHELFDFAYVLKAGKR